MANRRMFSKAVVDSDSFLEMPLSAQALYFHLGMRADDDGFLNNARIIRRMVGANEDDMKILTEKGYILTFESGVTVLTHWKLHNYIQADRYTPTVCKAEFSMLKTNADNIYCLVSDLDTECIQNVSEMEAQVRLGEEREDKDRKEEGEVRAFVSKNQRSKSEAAAPPPPPAPLENFGEYRHVKLAKRQYENLIKEYGQELVDNYIGRIDKYCQTNGKKYFDYELLIKEWIKEDGADNGIISGNTVTVRDSAYSTDI